jgi:hypothetical protein
MKPKVADQVKGSGEGQVRYRIVNTEWILFGNRKSLGSGE